MTIEVDGKIGQIFAFWWFLWTFAFGRCHGVALKNLFCRCTLKISDIEMDLDIEVQKYGVKLMWIL